MTARPSEAAARAAARQSAERLARYMTVTHLTHGEAGRALGIMPQTIRSYRRAHPEAAYVPPHRKTDADSPQQTCPSGGPEKRVWAKCVPVAFGIDSKPVTVSLAREPWMQQGGRV